MSASPTGDRLERDMSSVTLTSNSAADVASIKESSHMEMKWNEDDQKSQKSEESDKDGEAGQGGSFGDGNQPPTDESSDDVEGEEGDAEEVGNDETQVEGVPEDAAGEAPQASASPVLSGKKTRHRKKRNTKKYLGALNSTVKKVTHGASALLFQQASNHCSHHEGAPRNPEEVAEGDSTTPHSPSRNTIDSVGSASGAGSSLSVSGSPGGKKERHRKSRYDGHGPRRCTSTTGPSGHGVKPPGASPEGPPQRSITPNETSMPTAESPPSSGTFPSALLCNSDRGISSSQTVQHTQSNSSSGKVGWRHYLRHATSGGTSTQPSSLSSTSLSRQVFPSHHSSHHPVDVWVETVLPNLETFRAKYPDRFSALIDKGVPSEVRGEVWKRCLGDKLFITPVLYRDVLERLEVTRKSMLKHSKRYREKIIETLGEKRAYTPLNTPDGDIANTTAGRVSPEVDQSLENPRVQSHLPLTSPVVAASLEMISLDLNRTLPRLGVSNRVSTAGPEYPPGVTPLPFTVPPDGQLHEHLRTVLEAHVIFRPDIGYVQGMAYLAAMLLLHMDEYSAFVAFANLMLRNGLHGLYSFEHETTQLYFRTFDILLRDRMPQVALNLERCQIRSDVYLVEWFYTLFSRSLPFSLATRVWDSFICDAAPTGGQRGGGDAILFQTGLALLKYFQPTLEGGCLDACMALLSPSAAPVLQSMEPERFRELMTMLKISEGKVERVQASVREKLAQEGREREDSSTMRSGYPSCGVRGTQAHTSRADLPQQWGRTEEADASNVGMVPRWGPSSLAPPPFVQSSIVGRLDGFLVHEHIAPPASSGTEGDDSTRPTSAAPGDEGCKENAGQNSMAREAAIQGVYAANEAV